ncbi:MAG: poly-gamma-glutamate synthase PgsB [Coxiella sp. RIFCSPHIGHO2_12_FULL_42_15]|nr:MAG: poly-gamma-glutamate synthase PgsB [Coxiella sp. RIFCSPHIGHO2_12_FULL_42_15]
MNNINPFWYLLILFAILIGWLSVEAIFHRHYLNKIRYRIHVNGTRGKSSVSRLIAAGLRAGGFRTCAKTTGTLASFIFPDGKEEPIFRVGHTNVIEQVSIIRRAAKLNVDAIVIECMAVQPLLQSLCELKLVRSTHGVLTNARPDHLDVMGPTSQDVALALAGTMPVKGQFFTTAQQYVTTFEMAAKDRKTVMHHIDQYHIESVSDGDLAGFAYTEYKDNVALALAVCASLGVDRQIALHGMWNSLPDPGALTVYSIHHQNHIITLVNGLAANDPVSTETIWHKMLERFKDYDDKILIMNCRVDRKQRSEQIATAMLDWEKPHRCIAIGNYVQAFLGILKKKRYNKKVEVINGESWTVEQILNKVMQNSSEKRHLLVGVGNIAGIGFKLVNYFREHHQC